MDSNTKLSFLFIFLLFPKTSPKPDINIAMISKTLSQKGYNVMSQTLAMTLQLILPNSLNHSITIFCPPDTAFSSLSLNYLPLTFLQYHIVPFELDLEALKSSPKVETLLPGRRLLITISAPAGPAFVNNIKITENGVYNDGHVVVHGLQGILDPASPEILRYGLYDEDDLSWLKDATGDLILILYMAVVAAAILLLALVCFAMSMEIEYMFLNLAVLFRSM